MLNWANMYFMATQVKGCEEYKYSDQAIVDWKLGLLAEEPPAVWIRQERWRLEALEQEQARVANEEARKLSMQGASFGADCPACR